ncbi:MAG: hypothetical protein AAGA48_18375 [Myxococcota bacterium]
MIAQGQLDGVEVDRIDCDEYPCIATLRLAPDAALQSCWHASDDNPVQDWYAEQLGQRHSMSVNTSVFRHADFDSKYVVLAGYGEDAGEGVDTRTKYRMDNMVQTLGEDAAAEADEHGGED